MTQILSQEERDAERKLFDEERKRVPELFVRAPMVDDDTTLKHVGIENIPAGRPVGYLKLHPQDFIVEEISRDGMLHDINLEGKGADLSGEGATYFVDLVKVGISTLEVKDQLADILGVDGKNIGYAGIKDKLALTSQVISIRGVADPARINEIQADNFFLKNIRRGKGVVANGELQGNRFTITLRTAEVMTDEVRHDMERRLQEANDDGFWNFFYLQRFGTPRLLAHLLGRLIVKGDYEGAVKMFCTKVAPRELPYFAAIRQAVERQWGDWPAIAGMIDCFPYHFHLERSFIHHLIHKRGDFLGALHTLPDQIRLWIYSYDCYLFNRKLSELIAAGEVPLSLPLITSFNPMDWKPYEKFLEEDQMRLPSRSYRDFPFVRVESRRCATLQKLVIHEAVFKDRLATFSFSLPKGSYATTFLINFFTLASGLPIVPGIFSDKVDSRVLLGRGTLEPVLDRFKKVLEQREADLEGPAEE